MNRSKSTVTLRKSQWKIFKMKWKICSAVSSFLSFSILLVACNKENEGNDFNDTVDGLYTTYSSGGQFGVRKASLWKDGSQTSLLDAGTGVFTNSIAVASSGDIYVAGCECKASPGSPNTNFIDDCSIILWKNGTKDQLTQLPFKGRSAGYVRINSGGDVYVAGTESIDNRGGNNLIRLWKNGERQNITDGITKSSIAHGLFVSGADVFIIGEERDNGTSPKTRAVIWKNGAPQVLTDGTKNGRAVSIFVSGSDIYVITIEDNERPKLLKNAVAQTLPNNVWATKIFLETGDVYILGYDIVSGKRGVWKNGNLVSELSYGSTNTGLRGESIYVLNGDIYVGGVVSAVGEIGVIWKNGSVLHTLSDPSDVTRVEDLIVK